jgi:hypothetical protein
VGDPSDVDGCALEILRVVRPQLYENLKLMAGINLKSVRIETRRAADLKVGPIRHHDLPPSLLVRIQNIHFIFGKLMKTSLEEMIENFQRDLQPEQEIEVWEYIVTALHLAMSTLNRKDVKTKKKVFEILLQISLGNRQAIFEDAGSGSVDSDILTAAADAWINAVPPVTVSDVSSK